MQQSSSKQDRIAQYKALIARLTPKSKVGQGALRAFWVGGAICVLGQVISDIGTRMLGLTLMQASSLTSVTLVFLTALLTGIGVFDVIAKYAGAGTVFRRRSSWASSTILSICEARYAGRKSHRLSNH